MNVKYTYPKSNINSKLRQSTISLTKNLFLLSGLTVVAVNLISGGYPWISIVVYSMHFLYSLLISTDLFEYNLVSQSIKIISKSCILIILIGLTYNISPLLENIVPYICIGSIMALATLYFLDVYRHKEHIFPIVWFLVITIAFSTTYLLRSNYSDWEMPVTAILSFIFLIGLILPLNGDFIQEINKRFHKE